MNAAVHEVSLLLGSNIQPEVNLPLAVSLLASQLTLLRASSVWETRAIGSDGPNFLNMALLCAGPYDASSLKEQVIHPIEARLGRVRTKDKNAPRPIDIDIITFDQRLVEPKLFEFAFRAIPVAQVLPDYPSQAGPSLREIAAQLMLASPIKLRPDVMEGLTSLQGGTAGWPNFSPENRS